MACINLASSYEIGRGIPKDQNKANQLYRKICDGGSMWGCAILGNSYEKGLGVPKDLKKAKQLFRKACDGGYRDACKKAK